jgi:putative transposase
VISPHRHWPDVRRCGDLTEIPTGEGKLQQNGRGTGAAFAALCVAIAVRGGTVTGVVFHTDQGGAHTGNVFVDACRIRRSHRVQGTHRLSAGQRGLRSRQLQRWSSSSCADASSPPANRHAMASPPGSTNTNSDRRHSTNAMLSPIDYEHACITPTTEHGVEERSNRSVT